MSSKAVIEVTGVSKCFHIYERPQDRLKQSILPRLAKLTNRPAKTYFRDFWATKDISFTVNKGETVGIIGRNGSGKSTLLQMICGTLTPSSGTIRTSGRIAALLELGSGFNPEFSGRENVYMNAALLGLQKSEIDARYDDILKFADIGDFINEPVKTYSSGMMVRLAFAVQSQVDPDILVVDEALAVGDARFQAKCFERLKKLKDNGTSILLVTHSSEQIVTHCDRALLLENGKMLALDNPRTVVNKYLDLLFSKDVSPQAGSFEAAVHSELVHPIELVSDGIERFASRANFNENEYRWGDRSAAITDFDIRTGDTVYPSNIESGKDISLTLAITFIETIHAPIIGFTIKNTEGVTLFGCNTDSLSTAEIQSMGFQGQSTSVSFSFKNRLGGGDYFISVGIASRMGDDVIPHDRRYDAIHFQVLGNQTFHGLIDLEANISLHSKEEPNEQHGT